jgi:hypothetical protein
MDISVDIWLRGEVHATTQVISTAATEPRTWNDGDVTEVLTEMLRALDRTKNPNADPDKAIALRGFSWIVNPFETGGVVIAIELSLGAAIAGPFDIAESALTAMIRRVIDAGRDSSAPSSTETVH